MPNRFSRWLRSKASAQSSKEHPRGQEPQPPFLPYPRSRLITPDLYSEENQRQIKLNGPFFTILPSEVRQEIIANAFGEHSYHLDLSFDSPPIRVDGSHCGWTSAPVMELGLGRDRSLPKAWLWRSCVCHRDWPGTLHPSHVSEDKCMEGGAVWCNKWPGDSPKKCFVGVVGWLLSCRQAYTETIDILYSKPTFIINNPSTVVMLPRLLLAQRLAAINSLEIMWEMKSSRRVHGIDLPRQEDLPFDIVRSTFPNARMLHIVLYGDLFEFCNSRLPMDDEDLAKRNLIYMAADTFSQNAPPKLQEFYLAVPASVFNQLSKGEKLQRGGSSFEKFWRSLSDGKISVTGSPHSGYWVVKGHYDIRMIWGHGTPPSSLGT